MSDSAKQHSHNDHQTSAIVGIGMPVFNGGPTVAAAIECLLNQTHTGFELLISDNCSTDETGEICRSLAREDRRLRYVRQAENIGAEANFRFVLTHCSHEFFMWAAADDLRSTDFLEINLAFLREHPDYVGSTSPVRFANNDFDEVKMGDSQLAESSPHRRVLNFLSRSHANGRFYSLFRRSAIASWPHLADSFFLGADWTLVTHAARCGKLNRSQQGWVALGANGMSNRIDIYKRYRKSWLDWLIPYRKMSSDIFATVSEAPLSIRFRVLAKLMIINLRAIPLQFLIAYLRRSRI